MQVQLDRPDEVRISLKGSTRPGGGSDLRPLALVAARAFVLGLTASVVLITARSPSPMSVLLDGLVAVATALASFGLDS